MYTDRQLKAMVNVTKTIPENVIVSPKPFTVDAMVRNGFIVVKDGTICEAIPNKVATVLKEVVGANSRDFNEAFYQTFNRAMEVSDEQRILEQTMHYMTTYGAEAVGMNMLTYVPVRFNDSECPERTKELTLQVITIVSDVEMRKRLINYFCTIQTLTPLSRMYFNELREIMMPYLNGLLDSIHCMELMAIVAEDQNIIPNNPTMALRVMVYSATAHTNTILIKDRDTIENIKYYGKANHGYVERVLNNPVYVRKFASIFYRYKPIFLAFKHISKMTARQINRIRRLAPIYHQPVNEVSIKNYYNLNDEDRKTILDHATNRELVRLVSKGLQRVFSEDAVYQIRNGKIWVDTNVTHDKNVTPTMEKAAEAMDMLVYRLTPVLKDKMFYIPESFSYAVPHTERQMVGPIPYGSKVSCPDGNFIAGIHWVDGSDEKPCDRVDLDLHLSSTDGHDYGWNAAWRSEGKDIVFSGDMTIAPKPKGATEAYYIGESAMQDNSLILSVSTFNKEAKIDYSPQFYLTNNNVNEPTTASDVAIFNPNDLLFAPILVPTQYNDQLIGVFNNGEFHFIGGSRGSMRSPNRELNRKFINGILEKAKYTLRLDILLVACGAKVVRSIPEGEEMNYYNFSPESLKLDTLLNLVDGKLEEA